MFKNKKGFTLIEMLVVIAIIAVLVAIIIPVIGNSTIKASAAANAANLRSYASEIAIIYLDPGDDFTVKLGDAAQKTGAQLITVTGTGVPTAPTAKKCGTIFNPEKLPTAKCFLVNGQVVAAFADTYTPKSNDVEYFAKMAETGTTPSFT